MLPSMALTMSHNIVIYFMYLSVLKSIYFLLFRYISAKKR